MTLARRRELSRVVEALCSSYQQTTGRQVWSHHVKIAFFLALRMEAGRDLRAARPTWWTRGGEA